MPRAAIATGMVDYVLPLDAIAAALIQLVSEAESEGMGRPVGTG
jgi:chemotaxis response regulator CheB